MTETAATTCHGCNWCALRLLIYHACAAIDCGAQYAARHGLPPSCSQLIFLGDCGGLINRRVAIPGEDKRKKKKRKKEKEEERKRNSLLARRAMESRGESCGKDAPLRVRRQRALSWSAMSVGTSDQSSGFATVNFHACSSE